MESKLRFYVLFPDRWDTSNQSIHPSIKENKGDYKSTTYIISWNYPVRHVYGDRSCKREIQVKDGDKTDKNYSSKLQQFESHDRYKLFPKNVTNCTLDTRKFSSLNRRNIRL